MSYQIPNRLTDWNADMLVGLDGNFSEIQRFITAAEARISTLETQVAVLMSTST